MAPARRPEGAAFGLLVLSLAAGCLYAPAEEGYHVRAPVTGPTKLAPEGYRWANEGGCRNERAPNPYAPQGEETEYCDFRLVREAGAPVPSPSAAELPGCGKDTDCKGERVCEAGRCVDPK